MWSLPVWSKGLLVMPSYADEVFQFMVVPLGRRQYINVSQERENFVLDVLESMDGLKNLIFSYFSYDL